MANYKAKYISGDPKDATKDFTITFELYRDDRLIAKYVDANIGSGFVPSYSFKEATKEIYIESDSYFYDGFGVWGNEGTKYNIPENDIAKGVKINIEGYNFPEKPATPPAAAQGPTGDIQKFVEEFNKEFDAEIERLKKQIEDAKLTLATASTISGFKEGAFPENNQSVKTVGDLYKYVYNLETGEDLSPRYKSDGINTDTALAELVGDFDRDMNGSTLTPKQDLKSLRRKIINGLSAVEKLKEKNEIKKQQGKNPNLWSPGLYYFEYFFDEIKRYFNEDGFYFRDGERYKFTLDYYKAIREKKETFKYSITTFTPDGNIRISDSPFTSKGFSPDDGQAGYFTFINLLESQFENSSSSSDMSSIHTIGFQNNEQMFGKIISGSGSVPKPNKVASEGLKTLYLSGKLEELKKDPTFDERRGELADDGETFYGNWEVMSLYKAFIQAANSNYENVLLPLKTPEEKPKEEPVKQKVEQKQPELPKELGASQSTFVFNVEDNKTFFRKENPLELFIIPSTNDVASPTTTKYRDEDTDLSEEALDEEYYVLDEFQANNHIRDDVENAELEKFAEANKVSDPTVKQPAKTVDDKVVITPKDQQNNNNNNNNTPAGNNNTNTDTPKEKLVIIESTLDSSYGLKSLPPNSEDRYSELTTVPYYGQWDSRWGKQMYGRVDLKGGKQLFIEDPLFSKTFPVKNGTTSPRATTFKMSEANLKKGWKDNMFGTVRGKVNIGGNITEFEVQAHYEWHRLTEEAPYKGCGDLGFSTINAGGCGVTSLSMIVNYWGKKFKNQSKAFYTNPIKMAKFACENGGRPGKFPTKFNNSTEQACNGTGLSSDSTRKEFEKATGLVIEDLSAKPRAKDNTKILEELKAGRPVLFSVKGFGGYNGKGKAKDYPGHYMVISGFATIEGKNVIVINDPGSNHDNRAVYMKDVDEFVGTFWKISPKKPSDYT